MQGPELLIPPHLEVAHVPFTDGGPYPGLFLFAGMARWARPVQNLALQGLELLGSLEQANLDIRCVSLGRLAIQRPLASCRPSMHAGARKWCCC